MGTNISLARSEKAVLTQSCHKSPTTTETSDKRKNKIKSNKKSNQTKLPKRQSSRLKETEIECPTAHPCPAPRSFATSEVANVNYIVRK